jgi:hypothetical protein
VVREFRWSADAPGQNVNMGQLVSPHEPFKSCVEVAGFADADKLGFSNTGWIWCYDPGAEESASSDGGRDPGLS